MAREKAETQSIMKSILVSIDRSSDSTPAMELALLVGYQVRCRPGGRRIHRRIWHRGGTGIPVQGMALIAEREPAADRTGPAGLQAGPGAIRRPIRRCRLSCTTPSDTGALARPGPARGPAARPDRDGPAADPRAGLRRAAGPEHGPHLEKQPAPRRDRAACPRSAGTHGDEIRVAYDGSLQSARALDLRPCSRCWDRK